MLQAYELVPEAYRQKFRKLVKQGGHKLMWSLPEKKKTRLTGGCNQ